MNFSVYIFIKAIIGTLKNIPKTPNIPPPTVTANIINSGETPT